jgi:translation initiation factor IF-1
MDIKTKGKETIIIGIITEALPNTHFRIQPEGGGDIIMAYLGGKMKMHKIRVLVGDRVEVLIDPYGGKGRIIRRL